MRWLFFCITKKNNFFLSGWVITNKINISFMLSLLILTTTEMVVVFLFFLFLFKIIWYICIALHLVRALHIESVFAVLQENVEVFKNEGWTNDTHSLFAYGRRHTEKNSVFYPHIVQVWGLASFIFVRVFPQPSCW